MRDHRLPNPTDQISVSYEYGENSESDLIEIEGLLQNDEGYIIGRIGNELLRHKTDTHLITIAPTGAGKTSGSIIPNLIDHPGSAFIVDIRGETLEKTATAKAAVTQGGKLNIISNCSSVYIDLKRSVLNAWFIYPSTPIEFHINPMMLIIQKAILGLVDVVVIK